MQRRNFILASLSGAALLQSSGAFAAGIKTAKSKAVKPLSDRQFYANLLQKIAEPVLSNLSQGTFKANFPIELSPIWDGRPKNYAYLETYGRLISGLAPWLALEDTSTEEGLVRKKLRDYALASYENSVNPTGPDYFLWRGGQALVDSAYYTNALIRAPKQLWEPLSKDTKTRIVTEIKSLRKVSPPYTNWLLFASMNEAFLLMVGEDYDPMRVDLTLKKMEEWYVGDGWIADGQKFHFDYYNSFVMYPMIITILEILVKYNARFNNLKPVEELAKWQKRMQRYCEHLERLISPTGTFPTIGRSLTYRTAAFQPLALLALKKQLPAKLTEGQVRGALNAVHRAVFKDNGNFTKDGYLNLGFVGANPNLADRYSNNGSMYITTESFLMLGLPENDSFWTVPEEAWTQKKAFEGKEFPRDYAVDY